MQRTHPEEIMVELYSAAATGVVSPIVEKGDINNARYKRVALLSVATARRTYYGAAS